AAGGRHSPYVVSRHRIRGGTTSTVVGGSFRDQGGVRRRCLGINTCLIHPMPRRKRRSDRCPRTCGVAGKRDSLEPVDAGVFDGCRIFTRTRADSGRQADKRLQEFVTPTGGAAASLL